MFAADGGRLYPGLALPQNPDDLLFREEGDWRSYSRKIAARFETGREKHAARLAKHDLTHPALPYGPGDGCRARRYRGDGKTGSRGTSLFDEEGFLLELSALHFLFHPARGCAAPGPAQLQVFLAAVLRGNLSALER